MQKFLIVLRICVTLSININAQSPEEAKPSFNCAKAKSKVEKMICSDKSGELQKLDRLYSKLYFSILKSIPKDTKRGKKQEKNWNILIILLWVIEIYFNAILQNNIKIYNQNPENINQKLNENMVFELADNEAKEVKKSFLLRKCII